MRESGRGVPYLSEVLRALRDVQERAGDAEHGGQQTCIRASVKSWEGRVQDGSPNGMSASHGTGIGLALFMSDCALQARKCEQNQSHAVVHRPDGERVLIGKE